MTAISGPKGRVLGEVEVEGLENSSINLLSCSDNKTRASIKT